MMVSGRPPRERWTARSAAAKSAACALALSIATLGAACTYEDEGAPLPLPQRELTVTGQKPAPGQHDVPRNTPIEITFSAPLAAETISELDLRLFSGVVETTGKVAVDLIDQRLRLVPNTTLTPELRYRVYLRGSLRGLDGSRSGADPQIFDFIAGSSEAPPAPARPAVDDNEMLRLFGARCGSCHGQGAAAAGVDLSSAEQMRATLLGRQSPIEGVPLVRSGSHARSYLMRKLLDRGGFLGAPMPPTGPLLSADELRRVADWIDGLGS
jgi:mono/diheme cytochrome c family protein